MSDTTEQTTLSRGRPTHASSGPRRDAILALKAKGRSGVEIARELGVTPAAVSYHLKKAREQGVLPDADPTPADEGGAADD